jgi:hypothetical protein
MRSTRRIALAAATAAIGAALIAPAAGQATVTVGSNLARAPQLGLGCVGSCTFGLSALDQPTFAAANGVRSPVNGTVLRWRIRTGGSASQTALRTISPAGLNTYAGGSTSAVVTPSLNGISEHQTSIPIKLGDLIGINCCNGVSGSYFRIGDGDTLQWQPALGSGGSTAPVDTEGELLVNADIEPTSAFTNTKPKAKKGKVKFIATLPNPGTIAAGDPKDKKLKGVAAKAAKGPQLLTRTSKRLNAPGKAKLSVKLSKAAQKRLAANGRLSVRVRVIFTPDGGSSTAKTLKVKFAK